ncbi:hypothetical protein Sru01_24340 [Sphaerisporangium rufum]|uniref:Uncharacterized protein n=1 Tax=Sphaerisporangium rufum TaxID=1381558 RepID=A0A919R5F4_9ACTN|nr:hypothetical protein Sru01_24340 [Sphaerisporangium rufum]
MAQFHARVEHGDPYDEDPAHVGDGFPDVMPHTFPVQIDIEQHAAIVGEPVEMVRKAAHGSAINTHGGEVPIIQ